MLIRTEPPRYRAYMLRCWEVRSPHAGGPAVWRFSLEDPHTGDKQGFADLNALIEFLQAELNIQKATASSRSDQDESL